MKARTWVILLIALEYLVGILTIRVNGLVAASNFLVIMGLITLKDRMENSKQRSKYC